MEEQMASLAIDMNIIIVMLIITMSIVIGLLAHVLSGDKATKGQKHKDWTKSIVERALVSIAENDDVYYYIPQWVYIRKYYNSDVYDKSRNEQFSADALSVKARERIVEELESEHVQPNTKIVLIVNINVTEGHTNWNSITATAENVEKIIAGVSSIGYTERIALENKFNINN